MKNVHTAVILAAGKSTRTYPLTLDTSKCLLKVVNKTIIERTLDQLEGVVEEVILIVHFKKEKIQEFLGTKYKSLSLTYLEQKEVNGTGGAILQLKDRLHGKFFVLNGDDLYTKKDITSLLAFPYAVLAQKADDPQRFGVLETDDKGNLQNIIEKPQKFVGNMVNTGCYLLDEKIFEHELKKSKRGEFEITDYLLFIAKKYGLKVVPVSQYWLPIGYPWDLLEANLFLLQQEHTILLKEIPKTKYQSALGGQNPNSKNKNFFGENIFISQGLKMSGAVFIGKNVSLGKNVELIGPVCIEDNVVINDGCRISDSLIMSGSVVKEDSKIEKAIVTSKYMMAMFVPDNPLRPLS